MSCGLKCLHVLYDMTKTEFGEHDGAHRLQGKIRRSTSNL